MHSVTPIGRSEEGKAGRALVPHQPINDFPRRRSIGQVQSLPPPLPAVTKTPSTGSGRTSRRKVADEKTIADSAKPQGSLARSKSGGGHKEQEPWRRQESMISPGFWDRLRMRSRILCESWRFSVLTTVLTFYALFGDDFRLATTHKRTDILFNVLTIFCIVVFSTEIVAASLGKEEYFLGFFFALDFGSTVTLLLDLTWIANAIYCSSDNEGGALKSSRAGRNGARASRTVRIIRLIRLVKLYKTYKAAIEQKDKATSPRRRSSEDMPELMPGTGTEDDGMEADDHDEDLEDMHAEEGRKTSETRVGKKLSDMTTRRVIGLVLVMLVAMPLFVPQTYGWEEFRSSGALGADMVYERWRSWCFGSNSSSTSGDLPWCLQGLDAPADHLTQERESSRAWYEEYLLNFAYQHHSGGGFSSLFWLGINSTSLAVELGDNAGSYLSELAQLNQPRFLGSFALPADRLDEWDAKFVDPAWQSPVQKLSATVRGKLVRPWIERCSAFLGVAVSTTIDSELSSVCSIDEELRCSEVEYFMPLMKTDTEERHVDMMFAFDSRATTQLEAGLSMLQTIFICLAVGIGAWSFHVNANQLLLNPIERMIAKMQTIKDNPLEAMRLGDLEYRREEKENAKRREQLAKMGSLRKLLYRTYYMNKVREPMETAILEKTIIKLGGLLALGFGEAGAEIIGQNMSGSHSASVDAMVPGQKVDAIIGFCSISHFTYATEVLKEKVMVFVNQVGEIVHGCVDDFNGAPNKNIGDSFLIVWRLSGAPSEKQCKMADMAIMSFVKVVAEINKSRVLAVYRDHPGLLQRIANYRVQMSFGLHCGWAIEGAIGSELKIDASYLSPNVNVASRLEAATKQFGVWILISHFMFDLCSHQMAMVCRLIDHVTVKGSKQPIRLYTIDLDYMRLQVKTKKIEGVKKNYFKIRQMREMRKNEKWSDEYKVWEAFNTDADLIVMRSKFTTEFFQRFAMAYRNYEAGEWMVARDMLFTCHYEGFVDNTAIDPDEWPIDGPTVTLLNFMKRTHYYPAIDWPGHRELSEK